MEGIKKGKGSQVSKKGEDASVDGVLSTSIKKDPLLPVEILSMDDNFIQLYKKALHAGKKKVYNIRVMVVGQFGVGKTTLIKRLLGQRVDIYKRKRSEGIDVHKHCCKISLDKGEWIQQVEDSDQLQTLNRLIKLLFVPDQKPDINQDQEGINQVVYQREITSELDATKSNVPSTTSVSDQEVQSSTQVPITGGYQIHPLSNAKSSESKKKTKDGMMEIIRLVNANAYKLVQDIEKYAALSILDFAGQCAFYTTHQMFPTSRAIYLLVIDFSQQITDDIKDDDKCFLDEDGIVQRQVFDLFQIWINSIHSILKSPKDIVPVIVVGTHVDKIPEESQKEVVDKYFKELQDRSKDKPTICHLMGYIAIDQTQPHPMLEELKKSIFELSSQQPHWGEERPARWLPLEQAIMKLKASDTKIVPLSLIEEINMSGSIEIGRDELKLFLQFHHDIGTILHFSVEELREKIVLDPQWMIDALKSLITDETFMNKYPDITSRYYEFKENGKLTHQLIDVIWSKKNNLEFHNHKDHILRLMEQLNIIAKPRKFSEEGKEETKEEHYFLAPWMLQEKTPEEIISPKPNKQMESSPVLCYVFTGNFLPSAIFHRLVAACIAHWPVAKMKKEHREKNLIFCGCCVFQLDEQDKLTLHFREHVIFLRITRMGIKDKTPSSKLCIEVRQFITTNLEKIIGYLGKGLKFEYFIQCPEYNGVSINSLIPVSRLKEKAEVHCEFHDNMIESCKVLDFWFEHQEQTVIEGIEKDSKVSEKEKDASMDTSIKKEKLHMTVLNRCLKQLLECLEVKVVMIYIQQEELFDPVTTRDINEQTTTSDKIWHLIDQIQKRDQHTYVRFKECIIRAQQEHLKIMLDQEEENVAAEMKEKHRGPVVLDQNLAGHSTQAQADVPTPSPTAEIMQISASGSTSSTTVGLIHAPTTNATPSLTSITAGVMQTTNVLFSTTSASTLSTTTGSTTRPTPTSTTAVVMQYPSSGSTANVTQITTSGSTAANVIQTPTSGSTAANVIQTPTSGSTAAHISQSTAFGSKSSTTADLTPVMSSCCTDGALWQPRASSSIQSKTADVTHVQSHDFSNSSTYRSFAEASEGNSQMQPGATKELDVPQTQVKNIDDQDKDDVDAPITQEHINHARLCNALTTVCSNALRKILLANVPMPHTDIYKAILANKSELKRLNKDQFQLVFPDPQGLFTGKVEEFDISLLYLIVRNVSSVSAPTNGWGKPPADNPRDITLGASVERIRLYRNDISGHSVDGKISQQEFEDYWAKIDLVLREIEFVIGNHGYQEDLEKRKNQAITPQEANELQNKFQEYKKETEGAEGSKGKSQMQDGTKQTHLSCCHCCQQ